MAEAHRAVLDGRHLGEHSHRAPVGQRNRAAGIDWISPFPRPRHRVPAVEHQPPPGTSDLFKSVSVAAHSSSVTKNCATWAVITATSNEASQTSADVPCTHLTRSPPGRCRARSSEATAGSIPVTQWPAPARATVNRPVPPPDPAPSPQGSPSTTDRKKSSSRDHGHSASYTSARRGPGTQRAAPAHTKPEPAP